MRVRIDWWPVRIRDLPASLVRRHWLRRWSWVGRKRNRWRTLDTRRSLKGKISITRDACIGVLPCLLRDLTPLLNPHQYHLLLVVELWNLVSVWKEHIMTLWRNRALKMSGLMWLGRSRRRRKRRRGIKASNHLLSHLSRGLALMMGLALLMSPLKVILTNSQTGTKTKWVISSKQWRRALVSRLNGIPL